MYLQILKLFTAYDINIKIILVIKNLLKLIQRLTTENNDVYKN